MMKPVFKVFYILAMLLPILLVSCSIRIPTEEGNHEVYFCPRDNCSKAIEGKLDAANDFIYCAFYDLNLKDVISTLSKKSMDIDVKVVLDQSTYDGQIKGEYKLDTTGQLMHNKFCVIDGSSVITGSMNPTFNDDTKNSNNLLVFHSRYLSENYKAEFEELWSGKFGKGNPNIHSKIRLGGIKVESYFCPEDLCSDRVIQLIANANSSVYFMAFSFTDQKISDALISRKNIEIKGVLDSSQAAGKYSVYGRLKESGLDVIKDKLPGKMHHKVFVIDKKTVITGSYNPTSSGDTKNDENMLVIHDEQTAAKFLEEFENIYNIK